MNPQTSGHRPANSPLLVILGIPAGGALFLTLVLYLSTLLIDSPATREQERIFNEQQLLQTSLVAQAITYELELAKDDLSIIAESPMRQSEAGGSQPAYLGEALADEAGRNHDLLGMAWLPFSKDGRYGKAVPAPGMDRQAFGRAFGWATARWPDAAGVQPGQGLAVDLDITRDRQWLGLELPVFARSGGSPSGVMVCVLDLAKVMERHVKPMRSGKYGAGYVLDDEGTVVFDHESEIIGDSVFGGMHKDYPDLLRYDRRLVTDASGTDSYHFTVLRGGEVRRKLAAWTRVDLGGRFLVIALSAPDNEIDVGMAALRSQRTILTVVMAFLVIALTAVFFAARQRMLVRSARMLKEEVAERTAELSESRDTLSAMMEASPLAIAWANASGPIEYTNPAFGKLFGYTHKEVPDLATWFTRAYPDEDYRTKVTGAWSEALGRSSATGTAMEAQLVRIVCAGGTERMVSVLGAVVGQRILAIFSDETEAIGSRDRLEASLREKETLLRELYHRTKNNLYVIYSLLMLHADEAESGEARETLSEMALRIQSMALVHQMLYQSGNLSSVDMKEYVENLLALVAENYASAGLRVERRLRLGDARLSLERAVPLGLVLNELFTNAFRHAFLPRAGEADYTAVLEVSLERGSDGRILLEVADNGPGFAGGFDEGRDANMGLETVVTLVRGQLGGRIEFESEQGFRCRISVPENGA